MATAEHVIQKHREKLVGLLENLLSDPTLAAADQHSLLRILAGAVGDVHALKLLLLMHSHQLQVMEHQLLKPQRAGSLGLQCICWVYFKIENVVSVLGGSASLCFNYGIFL